MRLGPALVGPGEAHEAVNLRFREGEAVTRRGVVKPAWLNLFQFRWGTGWPLSWDKRAPLGTAYGAGVWSDPNEAEWMVVAAGGGVWALREGTAPRVVPCVERITGPVRFTQAFDVLVMWRGAELRPLVMRSLEVGFVVPVVTPIPGTMAIPNAARGVFFQNRLIVPYERDLVAVSDVQDYLRYAPATGAFRINEGSSDGLVALAAFSQTAVVALKQRSVFLVSSLVPDAQGVFSGAIGETLTEEFGCVAADSVAAVGPNLFFLSQIGVAVVRTTEFGKAQLVTTPLSRDVQPLIDRIHWPAASQARGVFDDNFYFLAVPLDGSTVNNAVLVFDALNEKWAGYDDGEAGRIGFYLRAHVGGRRRVVSVTPEGYVQLHGEGLEDEAEAAATMATTEVAVVAGPLNGESVQVNGGTTVVADTQSAGNGPSRWGAQDMQWPVVWPWAFSFGRALENLVSGYGSGLWSAPGCTVTVSYEGLVFTGTAGAAPQVDVTGSWAWVRRDVGVDVRPVGIRSRLVTRGYLAKEPGLKRFRAVRLVSGTWGTTWSVGTETERTAEAGGEWWVEGRVGDRTRYRRPFDAAPYDVTNANGDFDREGREDYGVTVPAAGLLLDPGGVVTERLAEEAETVRVRGVGSWCAVVIESGTGALRVREVEVEGVAGPRAQREE
jgi:hypothetical protein